jgi:hypothetical protein
VLSPILCPINKLPVCVLQAVRGRNMLGLTPIAHCEDAVGRVDNDETSLIMEKDWF